MFFLGYIIISIPSIPYNVVYTFFYIKVLNYVKQIVDKPVKLCPGLA